MKVHTQCQWPKGESIHKQISQTLHTICMCICYIAVIWSHCTYTKLHLPWPVQGPRMHHNQIQILEPYHPEGHRLHQPWWERPLQLLREVGQGELSQGDWKWKWCGEDREREREEKRERGGKEQRVSGRGGDSLVPGHSQFFNSSRKIWEVSLEMRLKEGDG